MGDDLNEPQILEFLFGKYSGLPSLVHHIGETTFFQDKLKCKSSYATS